MERKMSNETTDASFKQDVIESDLPVLVDFWAPWCGPCQTVGPMVDQIAEMTEGMVKVYKLNLDENPAVASEYGVRSIPTVIIFEKGQEKERFVGVVHPKSYFDALGPEVEDS